MDKEILHKYGFVVDISDIDYTSYKLSIGSVLFVYIKGNMDYYEVYYNGTYMSYINNIYDIFISELNKTIKENRDNKINVILE